MLASNTQAQEPIVGTLHAPSLSQSAVKSLRLVKVEIR